MAHLTFWGAAQTVTGSRHLLELQGKNILIDCGLFQGTKENRLRNWDTFPIPPEQINTVLLSHAHIDHSGYLPRLCREGFDGKILCTYPTQDLCGILLRDSAYLQEEDASWANIRGFSKHKPALPLYNLDDAERALRHFEAVYYGQDVFLSEEIRVKFKDAGHMLGAAFVDIKTRAGKEQKKLLFSGDVGRPDELLVREPVQVFNVDYLILESTYGDRLHDQSTPFGDLAKIINESVARGGVLLIPSFAVGRTQTLLYIIRLLEEAGEIPAVPVFVDSPMAIDATDIFKRRISDLNLKARMLKLDKKRIFQPQHVHFCRSRDESMTINNQKKKAIIISASGMATGGRILHHLVRRLPEARNTVLFVGYQAEGTRGRTILEGADSVKIHGEYVPVRAQIENISGFSGHADYKEILAWLMGFNKPPERTFLVHGEQQASEALATRIRTHFGWDVVVPKFGDRFELDL